MASTSGCSHQLKDLQLSDTTCMMNDSSNMSDFATVVQTSEFDHATSSMSYFSAVEEQIELSKAHWSTLVDHPSDTDEEEVKVSNEQEFAALQSDPTYGSFFANFSGDGMLAGSDDEDLGELVIGKKFAEGGQAELFEAHFKWNNPNSTKPDLMIGREYVLKVFKNAEIDSLVERKYVLKVFKKGTLLKDVKSQLPQGLLLDHVERSQNLMSPTPKLLPWPTSSVFFGILLKDRRFAFLMRKEDCDLRTLIQQKMKLRSGGDCGPFSKEKAELIMYQVALGVDWLHNRDIVHRDLKASNVLVKVTKSDWPGLHCFVADHECSIGVLGTGFFRAPEILQACKERKVNERPEVFSRAADVYSYGMICYEILTGKLPFEDHPLSGNHSLLIDLVVNQHLRPEVPEHVEGWTRELLDGCWQFDPTNRPTIGEILDVISTNSSDARGFQDWFQDLQREFAIHKPIFM